MGIETLNKAAQAAGLAMATSDEPFPRKKDKANAAEAWQYSGPRAVNTANKPETALKTAKPKTSWLAWWTGRATA